MSFGPDFVVAIILITTVGWVVTTAIRARHGYPLEGEWGGTVHKKEPETDELKAQNQDLKATVGRLEERLKVLTLTRISRVKAINEGETTLFDNSLLMFASSLFDGNGHTANRLPVMLAGKGGGSLKTGRVLEYLDRGNDHRRMCSLHLSLMDRMGVKLDRFGDASTRLADL